MNQTTNQTSNVTEDQPETGAGGEGTVQNRAKQPLQPTPANARSAAELVVQLWNEAAWRRLYTLLLPAERTAMTPEQFALFMRVTSPDTAVEHDPSLQWVFRQTSFRGAAGETMRLSNVTLQNNTAHVTTAVTVRNVPLRKELSFTLRWRDGWLLQNSFFNGTSVGSVCPATGYSDYCYAQYGEEFHDLQACDHAGKYLAACYQASEKEPETNVMITACGAYTSKWDEDSCLLDLALATGDEDLCLATRLPHHEYRCRGIIAGLNGNLDPCLDAVNTSSNTASYDTDNCHLGFAIAQQNQSLCKRDWSDDDLRRECYEKT